MSVDETTEDNLRGRPLIGLKVIYDNPKDLAFGKWIYRDCDYCLYREDGDGNRKEDCEIVEKPAHAFFGISEDEVLPETMDGKKVGNFCPYFADFRAD